MCSEFVLYGAAPALPTRKAVLMLSMVGAAWRLEPVNPAAGETRTPDFLGMSRFGQIPTLLDGGVAISQSNAILLYLAERFGRFMPAHPGARHRVHEWLFWETDFLQEVSSLLLHLRWPQHCPFPAEDVPRRRARAERGIATLDDALAGGGLLVGAEPTVADVACFPFASHAEAAGLSLAPHPHLRAWLEQMAQLPGVREAVPAGAVA